MITTDAILLRSVLDQPGIPPAVELTWWERATRNYEERVIRERELEAPAQITARPLLRPTYELDEALTTRELIEINRIALIDYYEALRETDHEEPMPDFRDWAACQIESELFAQREAPQTRQPAARWRGE